jgi:hypothetical protein
MMELKVVSWMPLASMPTMLGLNSTSGQRKRSLPMVMTCAGSQQYAEFLLEAAAADLHYQVAAALLLPHGH